MEQPASIVTPSRPTRRRQNESLEGGSHEPLLAAFDGGDGEVGHQLENPRGDPLGQIQYPFQHAVAAFAFAPQRQRAHETADQTFEILVVAPLRQGESFEPTHQLIVGLQRVARLLRAKADQRNAQFIAKEAQEIEEPHLFAHRAGPQAVDLVDDEQNSA